MDTKYLSVCLSVLCLSARISKTTRPNLINFTFACSLWPCFGPPVVVLRYIMYFRFCACDTAYITVLLTVASSSLEQQVRVVRWSDAARRRNLYHRRISTGILHHYLSHSHLKLCADVRPSSWKIEKSWSLRNWLNDFHTIWRGDASRPSRPHQPVKYRDFKNSIWRTTAILKNKKNRENSETDWLISMKFVTLMHISLLNPMSQKKIRTSKIQDGGWPTNWKWKITI